MRRKTPIERHSLSHRSQVDLREWTWEMERWDENAARSYRNDDAVHATNASFTDLTGLQQASSAPNQTLGSTAQANVGKR